MQHRVKHRRARWGAALTALVSLALVPASAQAQYTAPPPEPGFEYIFDGTATGSDASFDKWLAANGATAVTLDPALGAMDPEHVRLRDEVVPGACARRRRRQARVHVAGHPRARRRTAA